MTGTLIQIVDSDISFLERPLAMPPTILELKRFAAGRGDFGGEEGTSMDAARIELVALPQPAAATSRVVGFVNGDGFTLGLAANCYVGKNLVFGPLLICGQTPSGRECVLTDEEAWEFDLVWGDHDYPELKLREPGLPR